MEKDNFSRSGDAQTPTIARLAPATERYHRLKRYQRLIALLSSPLLTPSTSLSITCTRAQPQPMISRLFLPPRDGRTFPFDVKFEMNRMRKIRNVGETDASVGLEEMGVNYIMGF